MILLEAISKLDINNKWLLKAVIKVIEVKLDSLNYRDSKYDSKIHGIRDHKYEYLANALDSFNIALVLLETTKNKDVDENDDVYQEIMDKIEEGVLYIENCQNEYGGLNRLKVYH